MVIRKPAQYVYLYENNCKDDPVIMYLYPVELNEMS